MWRLELTQNPVEDTPIAIKYKFNVELKNHTEVETDYVSHSISDGWITVQTVDGMIAIPVAEILYFSIEKV